MRREYGLPSTRDSCSLPPGFSFEQHQRAEPHRPVPGPCESATQRTSGALPPVKLAVEREQGTCVALPALRKARDHQQVVRVNPRSIACRCVNVRTRSPAPIATTTAAAISAMVTRKSLRPAYSRTSASWRTGDAPRSQTGMVRVSAPMQRGGNAERKHAEISVACSMRGTSPGASHCAHQAERVRRSHHILSPCRARAFDDRLAQQLHTARTKRYATATPAPTRASAARRRSPNNHKDQARSPKSTNSTGGCRRPPYRATARRPRA